MKTETLNEGCIYGAQGRNPLIQSGRDGESTKPFSAVDTVKGETMEYNIIEINTYHTTRTEALEQVAAQIGELDRFTRVDRIAHQDVIISHPDYVIDIVEFLDGYDEISGYVVLDETIDPE